MRPISILLSLFGKLVLKAEPKSDEGLYDGDWVGLSSQACASMSNFFHFSDTSNLIDELNNQRVKFCSPLFIQLDEA
jgi:hypothetical protein